MSDLKHKVFANGIGQKIVTIGQHIIENATRIAITALKNPALAEEQSRQLQSEVSHAFAGVRVELDDEKIRREGDELKIHEPIVVGDEDDEAEPTHDHGNPVGSGVRGCPVPQSDRVGG